MTPAATYTAITPRGDIVNWAAPTEGEVWQWLERLHGSPREQLQTLGWRVMPAKVVVEEGT